MQISYGEGCNLSIPSKQFFKAIKEGIEIISSNIDNIIFTIPLRKNLLNLLSVLDFSFIPACHRDLITNTVKLRVVNTLLTKYLKDQKQLHIETNKTNRIRKRLKVS